MKIYVNVMELLVEQEVVRQLHEAGLTQSSIDTVAITTYALNRVPPLYACSSHGFREQLIRGHQQYKTHIEQAVRWAVLAVQRDLRVPSKPLTRNLYEKIVQQMRLQQRMNPLNWPQVLQILDIILDQLHFAESGAVKVEASGSPPGMPAVNLSSEEAATAVVATAVVA